MIKRFTTAVLTFAVAFAAGCSSDDDGPTGNGGGPQAIAFVSGNQQLGAVGSQLLEPFVVRVTDADGDGVSGVSVDWAVIAGGGSVNFISSTTNADGETSVTLTLGPNAGDNAVTASATGLSGSPLTFTAEGLVPTTLLAAGGGGQMARTTQTLAAPLSVEVEAADGRGVPGVAVSWSVTLGSSTLSASTTTTGANGVATVDLTLGSSPATDSISATVAGLTGSPIFFEAMGTDPVTVTVEMENIAFNAPGGGDDITILLGDEVRWVNLDSETHTATSNSVPSGGSTFDSGVMSQNDEFSFVPDTRGTWIYFCEVHPAIMLDARIIVQ